MKNKMMLIALVIVICFAGQMNAQTYNIQLISWVNNPPYYVSNHRRIGMVAQTYKYHFYWYTKADKNMKFKLIDNPQYHIKTENQLIDLLSERNKTRLLEKLNTSSDSTNIFLASATTKKVEGLFKSVPVIQRDEVVVIMRTADLLFIKQLFNGFWNCRFLLYISVLCAINFAAVIWLIERRNNDSFRNEFGAGLWISLWYCFVTMTTVGYGDKVPKKFISRVLCLLWMFCGIMLIAMITTTVMESIQGVSSKVGMKIAISQSSIEESFVKSQLSAEPIRYNTYEEIMNAVRSGKADAGFLDTNTAAYVFKYQNISDLKMETTQKIPKTLWSFIYYNDNAINFTLKIEKDKLISKEAEMRVRTHFVPSYVVSRYYSRNFNELFNGQDNGLVLYLTIIACIMVTIGIISKTYTEVKRYRKKKKRNQNPNDIAMEQLNKPKTNLLELDAMFTEIENQFKERLQKIKQELEENNRYPDEKNENICQGCLSLGDRIFKKKKNYHMS